MTKENVMNTYKALIILLITAAVLTVVFVTYIATPPNSGMAMFVGLMLLPFAAASVGCLFDPKRI